MLREVVSYSTDGLQMRGELFFEPGEGKRPGVLVFPEAFGISEHAISRAERLAGLGFVALACDIHGDGRLINDPDVAARVAGLLLAAPARTRDRAGSALAALARRPEVDAHRIAAIGFCFGGTMALELARSGADVKAVVGFHSVLGTKVPFAMAGSFAGRILVCLGADDPFVSPEQRTAFEGEMRAAQLDWQMHVYGNAVHSFTDPDAARRNMPGAILYSPEADARSWASMRALLAEALG